MPFTEFAEKYLPPPYYVDIKNAKQNSDGTYTAPSYLNWREDERLKYSVIIPDEIIRLRTETPHVKYNCWHFREVNFGISGNEGVFELVIYDGLATGAFVNVVYGEKSGIIGLEIRSWTSFICDLPLDFNIDTLKRLLLTDLTGLCDFVLMYGRHNKAQKERIEKYGI